MTPNVLWFKQFISKENGLGKAKMRHKPYPTMSFLRPGVIKQHKPNHQYCSRQNVFVVVFCQLKSNYHIPNVEIQRHCSLCDDLDTVSDLWHNMPHRQNKSPFFLFLSKNTET